MKHIEIENQEGFTLVEVIISIAVLGLICAVVLRLFVLANEVSEQSRIEDIASIYASNAIEVCKQSIKLDEIKQHSFFKGAKFNKDEPLYLEGLIEYNDNWQLIPHKTNEEMSNPSYQLEFVIKQADVGKATTKDVALMDISIIINQYEKETMQDKVLLEYTTKKYFVFEELAYE